MKFDNTFQCPDTGVMVRAEYDSATRRLVCTVDEDKEEFIKMVTQDGEDRAEVEARADTMWRETEEWCKRVSGTVTDLFAAERRLRDKGTCSGEDAFLGRPKAHDLLAEGLITEEQFGDMIMSPQYKRDGYVNDPSDWL